MNEKWHSLSLKCPHCDNRVLISVVCFAADGEILVKGVCGKCQIQLAYPTCFEQQIARCYALDLSETLITLPTPRYIQ